MHSHLQVSSFQFVSSGHGLIGSQIGRIHSQLKSSKNGVSGGHCHSLRPQAHSHVSRSMTYPSWQVSLQDLRMQLHRASLILGPFIQINPGHKGDVSLLLVHLQPSPTGSYFGGHVTSVRSHVHSIISSMSHGLQLGIEQTGLGVVVVVTISVGSASQSHLS